MPDLLQLVTNPFNFLIHFTAGLIDVLRGNSWRSSVSLDAEEAYAEGVWQEGGEELPERDRHFHQVGATFRGSRITDEQHDELCDSIVRDLKLDQKKVFRITSIG
jgi:hypothetical protein